MTLQPGLGSTGTASSCPRCGVVLLQGQTHTCNPGVWWGNQPSGGARLPKCPDREYVCEEGHTHRGSPEW
jgi:hypothetical protein